MSNQPSHIIRYVEGEGDKSYSTRIGVAWQHKDGKGFNLKINFLPLSDDGFMSMREAKTEEAEQE